MESELGFEDECECLVARFTADALVQMKRSEVGRKSVFGSASM